MTDKPATFTRSSKPVPQDMLDRYDEEYQRQKIENANMLPGERAEVERSERNARSVERGQPLYAHPDVEGPADDDEEEQFDAPEHNVARNLRKLAELFNDRYQLYGDNYKRVGAVMRAMFPDGRIVLETDLDFLRFGLFVQMTYKLTRYASTFDDGGHRDSLDDLPVYAQMLADIDAEALFEKFGRDVS